MRAGVIGTIDGKFDEIESFHQTQEQDGRRFTRSLQVNRTSHRDSGYSVYVGEAATQVIEDVESVKIDPETGEIGVGERPTKESKYTQFVAVPGLFIAVSSGSGTFAFDLLQSQHPGTHIERAELNLNAYADDYYTAEGVDPWQIGFYGNIGQAEKGVVYGENVISDDDIGDVLERSQINQLGLQYEMMDYDMKVTLAESGYVEVYNPSNIETEEFAEYIADEILAYEKEQ